MTTRQTDPDDDDAPARRRVAPALLVVLALVGVVAVAYGTYALGLWGGPSAEELATRAEREKAQAAEALARRAEAAAQRNANAPMLSSPSAAVPPGSAPPGAVGASGVGPALAEVTLAADSVVAFTRAPGPARIEVLSLNSVAFGNAQRMLQFAVRASNTAPAAATFNSATFRLVTSTQTVAPVDKFEESVAPGASADGLVTFVVGAAEKVQALRLVHGSESQDLALAQ